MTLWPQAGLAQTTITPTLDVAAIVDAFTGPGINVSYAELLTGVVASAGLSNLQLDLSPTTSVGIFDNGPLGIVRGALLTSGDVMLALPPNTTESPYTTGATGVHVPERANDPFCDLAIGNAAFPSRDSVRLTLEFTLDEGFDGIEATYVFGSEEWPFYRNDLYADAFGIFVQRAGTTTWVNIGVDEDDNNININGPFFSGESVISTLPTGDPSISGYNGLTPKITNGINLSTGPLNTHTMVFVVCDATDQLLDSGLFVSTVAGCNDVCDNVRFCGNGVIDPGEICDDGNNIDDDGCTNSCSPCEDTAPGGEVDRGCTASLPVCANFGQDVSTCELCDDDTVGGIDSGCDEARPDCDPFHPGGPACVECTTNAQCPPGSICSSDGSCVACEDTAPGAGVDSGCTTALPICDGSGTPAATCVACVDNTVAGIDLGCSTALPACDEAAPGGPTCVECTGDPQCAPGVCRDQVCVVCEDTAPGAGVDFGCDEAEPICLGSGTPDAACVSCIDDTTAGIDSGCDAALPACDPAAPGGPTCVECTITPQCEPDAICSAAQVCVPCEDTAPGAGLDAGCAAPKPICLGSGTDDAHCVACIDDTLASTDTGCTAALPACDEAASGGPQCVECTGDPQCAPDAVCSDDQTCVPCIDTAPGAELDHGCVTAEPICLLSGTDDAGCVACIDDSLDGTDTGCHTALPHCVDLATVATCVACRTDADCPDGGVCDDRGVCGAGNRPPIAVDDVVVTPEDTAILIDVAANDFDPDGDTLTVSAALVEGPGLGEAVILADGSILYTPDPGVQGVDSFIYEVCDPDGRCDTARVVVYISPTPDAPLPQDDFDTPVAVDDQVTTTGPINFDPTANDYGVDGAPIAIVALDEPSHGTATLEADGTVTYTPDDGFIGTDTFEYVISDDQGNTDTGRIVVHVLPAPNRGPTATDDRFRVSDGAPTPLDVLANDTDPDGDALTVVAVVQPAHGTVRFGDGGRLVYTPELGYCGLVEFTYVVSDPYGAQDTARVVLVVGDSDDDGVCRDPDLLLEGGGGCASTHGEGPLAALLGLLLLMSLHRRRRAAGRIG